jgi:hypothetical protein
VNAALRRRHFRLWLFLLVVLPLLVGLGLAVRPHWPSQPAPAGLEAASPAPGAAR